METIKIKGKDYITVNERLKAFREEHKDYALRSALIHFDTDMCVVMATIEDENGRILATGLAQEDRSSSMINKSSYVENAETSAWGRALGNLGYGIDTSVASADEVAMAIAKQDREVVGGTFIMPGGKHQGLPLSAITDEYLNWYLENGRDDFIKENIRKWFKDKQGGIEI